MAARRATAPLGLSVAAAVLVGACLAQALPRLPDPRLSAALCVAGLSAWALGRRLRTAGALLCGFAWAAWCASRLLAVSAAVAPSLDAEVAGRILDLPKVSASSTRFELAVDAANEPRLAGQVLRLAWYGRAPRLDPGSRWRLAVRLHPPATARNPGSYDPARQALAQGRVADGYVRASSPRRPLAAGRGIDAWREHVARAIDEALPDGRGRFVRALAIGDTRGLSADDWFVLRATGLTHQIAISGFHVGMVAGLGALLVRAGYGLLPWLGRRAPRPQAAAVGALLVATYYAAVAGFSLPTVRTLLMIAVALGARLWRRRLGTADALALALLAVLAVSPLAVLAPGFWLSFLGVAWLLWCMPGHGGHGVVRPFAQAQAVAVIGLLPLTVWFFGQASLLGPLANAVGIPVISLGVVPLALLGLLAHAGGWAFGASACWHTSATLMDRLWQALSWGSQSPWALWWLPTPGVFAAGLALAGAFWLLMPRGTPGRWLAICLLMPLLRPLDDRPPRGALDLVVLDVGKGDSILLRTANHVLFVDTGPGQGSENAPLVALHALGLGRVDAVLVSHADAGRIGGLASLRRLRPGVQVVAPEGWAAPGDTRCRAGRRWQWDGVTFEFLHPPAWFPHLRGENSCVLRVSVSGHAALLPAEIGPAVQDHLAASAPKKLRADWLLAPRHGRRGSLAPAFLAGVAPAWVVASSPGPGHRGAADDAVLTAYARAGAHALTTADEGSMRFRLDASGVRRLDAGPRADRSYWRTPR